jgi:two-component system phosphate regulon sensor histidine kinase PhoR
MELTQFGTLISEQHPHLLSHWRQQLRSLPSARHLDIPTLNDHMPALLDELTAAFQADSSRPSPATFQEESAVVHGLQRLQDGFDIEEVVAEYNLLRACIHDLADEHGFNFQGKPFHILNRVFDQAIGLALQTYATQRALEVKERREEYLAFVAHDLHTPLFAISLAGRSLERNLPKHGYTEDSALMLQTLRRGVHQLEGLVQQVLAENSNLESESGQKLVRREFDLWPLVEALVEDLETVAKSSDTRLVNQVPYDLVVFADASLVRRIFQNLMANAIHYTPGGIIRIGAEELPAERAIECWVKDNGSGVPPELLDKIFDKGESDPANEAGTGLGLAIVQAFTEAHGGRTRVESKPGEGTTFRFTLPLKAQSDSEVK